MPTRDFSPTRLRTAREHAGLSREKLARRAGCSASSIVHYEYGTSTPSVRMLTAIAGALNIDPGDLFGATPTATPTVVSP